MTSKQIEPLAWSITEFCMRIGGGIGRSTVYEAIKRGELEIAKLGDRTLITDQEGRRWLASKRVRGGKPVDPVEG
jgi:excisionase family DNA binding protein